jgi:hypothetical protein
MHAKQVVNTIKGDPRLAHLLEKSRIKLQHNYKLPSPPTICEEWWDEAVRLIKKKNKTQPKFGLGYVHDDSTTSEDDGANDLWPVMCHMISVISNQEEECATYCDEDDNPYLTSYQPCSFCVAANAPKDMRNDPCWVAKIVPVMKKNGQVRVCVDFML